VVADVALAHANGGKPEGLAFVDGQTGDKTIVTGLVGKHVEMLFVRRKKFLEGGEDSGKVLDGLSG
jgi:hypothetical protein